MEFSKTDFGATKEILANDHFVSINYDCTSLSAIATEGVILAGTIIPANDATAVGVLRHDVDIERNPNGSLVVHGFVNLSKLPATPSEEATTALSLIKFM